MSPFELDRLISDSLFIDAHCHGSDFPSPPSLSEVLEREKILCLSSATDPESVRKGAALNRACPRLLHGAGIHPWNAGRCGPADLEGLLPFFREAHQISEIGMDSVWAPPEADGQRQEALFLAQLKLACREGKPVTLHTKGTEERILELLRPAMPPAVLVHWFDGDDSQLGRFIDMGCFFSLSPAVIRDRRQREICRRIPKDRLLPETDNPSTWPWLFGAPAEAGQIKRVYAALAGILELSEEELRLRFRENAAAFLLA